MSRLADLRGFTAPGGPPHGGRDFQTVLAEALRKAEAEALGLRTNPEPADLLGTFDGPGVPASWRLAPMPAATRLTTELAMSRSARLAYAAGTRGSADLFKSSATCRR